MRRIGITVVVIVVLFGLAGFVGVPVLAQYVVARRPNITVLFMSGFASRLNLHLGRPGAGASFLQKPFAPEGLARKVRESLDRKQPTHPL